MKTWDVFISHASEDKETIVEPLVQLLEENGISCWYDKKDIGWGDSIVESISDGLKKSKYALVVLSENFISKGWTKAELNSMLNMEIDNGQKKVLPLIVGDEKKIIGKLPLLQDKKYIVWNKKSSHIVYELRKVLSMSIHITKRKKLYSLNKNYLIILGVVFIGIFIIFTNFQNSTEIINDKNTNPAIVLLAEALTKEVKEKEHWKEKYYELIEKYKEYPEIVTKAKNIQNTKGYQEAVNFLLYKDLKKNENLFDNYINIEENMNKEHKFEIIQEETLEKNKNEEIKSDIIEKIIDIQGIWSLKKYLFSISESGSFTIYRYINNKDCYREYRKDDNFRVLNVNNIFYLEKNDKLLNTHITKIDDMELEIANHVPYTLEKENLDLNTIISNICN